MRCHENYSCFESVSLTIDCLPIKIGPIEISSVLRERVCLFTYQTWSGAKGYIRKTIRINRELNENNYLNG